MTWFLILILLLHVLVLVYCIFHVNQKHFPAKAYMERPDNLPFVSVLVAARNEEDSILICLESLSKLNYPEDKFEVLIGNDSSSDKTAAIVADFIKDNSNFRLINITQNLGLAKGKANVLAQLARQATGEYFLITDADMQVPPNWIQSHLKHFSDDVYMTSGITLTKPGDTIFSKMQNLEWLYLMGLFNSIDNSHPVTAMGNNMAFRADKYFETGRYENLPFSVTEDIQLMQEFAKRGYKHKHILAAENLSFQKPFTQISQLLKQRKRWFQGGKKQPFFIWLLFLIYASFLPALLILFLLDWKTAIYILALKCFADAIFLQRIAIRLQVKSNILCLPIFEIYLAVINPLVLLYSVFTKKVEWKERRY